MSHYSIDLGIHPASKGGHGGDADDPYPMQIALTDGTLVQDQESRLFTGFTPEALASFEQIKGGDTIIFRVFETTPICPLPDHSLVSVDSFTVVFSDFINGQRTSDPWSRDQGDVTISSPTDQLSLAFTSESGGMELPCYFQRYNSTNGIVAYTVSSTSNTVPYLFSVQVRTTLTILNNTGTFYYRDDPEMVVSPDEDPYPGQPPVFVATSR